MGVTFLIGRAGTGKTEHCIAEIRAHAAASPLGPPLYWIVPDQATFSAERSLLTKTGAKDEGGVGFRVRVVSFSHLARLIGRNAGWFSNGHTQPLDTLARIVLLEDILQAQHTAKMLRVLTHTPHTQNFKAQDSSLSVTPGFLTTLDITLRDLRQHNHTGTSLRELAARPALVDDSFTRDKLLDLADLLDAWTLALNGADGTDAPKRWDAEHLLHHAALAVDRDPALLQLAGSHLWIDGHSTLTPLERRLLTSLCRHAESVTITLLADPTSDAFNTQLPTPIVPDALNPFARTERLHRHLLDTFRKEGIRIQRTEKLLKTHRFRNAPLIVVESSLFPTKIAAASLNPEPSDPEPLKIWECTNPETEVRAVVQSIRDRVEAGGLRYRDIGIIVPSLADYQDALRRTFTEFRIPHFIDERRSIAHHPLAELLRSALTLIADRWSTEDLLLYLKTDLAGLSVSDTAALENYLLTHGITRQRFDQPWHYLAPNQHEEDRVFSKHIPPHAEAQLTHLNVLRRKIWLDLQPLDALVHGSADAAIAPSILLQTLRELLTRLHIEATLEQWSHLAQARQQPEESLLHQQAWRQITALLDLLIPLLGATPRPLSTLQRLLDVALSNLTLGLIPPTLDQVLVSSVTRSRVPGLREVFLIGAIEGQFPHVPNEDPLLPDAQREKLNALMEETQNNPTDEDSVHHSSFNIHHSFGLTSSHFLLEMPFFDYTAFTRASDRLTVTYPIADRQGRTLTRSRYIPRLMSLVNIAKPTPITLASRAAADQLITPEELLTAAAAFTGRQLRRRAEALEQPTTQLPITNDPLPPNPLLLSLTKYLTTATGPLPSAWSQLLRVLRHRRDLTLATPLAQSFYPPTRPLRLSVSQLEKFAACPLQYYMHYTLGLRKREPLALDTLHLGLLLHRALERVHARIIARTLPWPDCDPHLLRKTLHEQVDAAAIDLHGELAQRAPGYAWTLDRAKRQLAVILEAERRRAHAGHMRPLGTEITFDDHGTDQTKDLALSTTKDSPRRLHLPLLRITTPHQHTVTLSGKIDRVDADDANPDAVSILDYKSSAKKELKLLHLYWGLSLQLPTYALVMQSLAHKRPIAALYTPLGIRNDSLSHPDEKESANPSNDAFFARFKPRGILDADALDSLDTTLAARDHASTWFPAAFTQKGTLAKRGNDALPHDDFATVLNFTRFKIAQMTDALMLGHIGPAPYRDGQSEACDNCDFLSLCPFDRKNGTFKDLPTMKPEEVLTRMRADLNTASAE